MSCSCSRTHRVKPYETCIFCAHKHIAAGLALRDESNLVGQLILASWHYRDDFPEMEAACIECAERIERAEPYRDSLAALCIRAWQMVLDNQESKAVYAAKSADDPMPFAPDAVAAHRAVGHRVRQMGEDRRRVCIRRRDGGRRPWEEAVGAGVHGADGGGGAVPRRWDNT